MTAASVAFKEIVPQIAMDPVSSPLKNAEAEAD